MWDFTEAFERRPSVRGRAQAGRAVGSSQWWRGGGGGWSVDLNMALITKGLSKAQAQSQVAHGDPVYLAVGLWRAKIITERTGDTHLQTTT